MISKRSSSPWAGLIVLGLAACGSAESPSPKPDDVEIEMQMNPKAVELSRRFLIVDTHVDVPYRLYDYPADVGERTEGGDFDFPRAVAGGLDVPFMSIYVPASYQETGGAKEFADRTIDVVEGLVESHPDKFVMVAGVDEAADVLGSGKLGFAMGIENGAPIEGDLANLRHFHDRGVRYITLTHSENNHICDSSYATERTWGGLSPFGRELVAEMNRVGMMIDVSHVSDAAFEQVLEVTTAPVIASHSSLRHFTPDWERNLSDEMVRALGANGGVAQINFGSTFLRGDSQKQGSAYWKVRGEHMTEHELAEDSEELAAWEEAYWSDKTKLYADVSDVADHIDRVVELAGIDHVGIGSDFDGVGDSLPTGLKDVSQYPNLIAVLLERGYSEEDIEKICAGNVMRVWREVERIAAGGSAVDMTRLVLLYGVWIAVAMILMGVAVMIFSGRGQKWFLPRTVLGWFGALGGFILFGIGAFCLAVFVFIDVGGKGDALRTMESARGARAPELSFAHLDGTPGALADFAGKVVLVNFWATWCPPCIEEMPELDRLQREYADRGLVVLHLSDEESAKVVDWSADHPTSAMHGIVERGYVPDPPFDAMNQARPVSFAIDRDGFIRDTAMGRMTGERFESMVLPHL